MSLGDVSFFCGKDGFVHVEDGHDAAATAHCNEMNIAYRARVGEFAGVEQQIDWLIEGREASERRASIRPVTP